MFLLISDLLFIYFLLQTFCPIQSQFMYDDYSMQSTEYEDESSDKYYGIDPYYDSQEFVPKKSKDKTIIQKGKF